MRRESDILFLLLFATESNLILGTVASNASATRHP